MPADPHAELVSALLDPTRFSIVSLLAATTWAEFGFVRDTLELTPSALSKQITTLSGYGLLDVEKGYVGRRPRTWLRLSVAGRAALAGHVAALQEIARRATEAGRAGPEPLGPFPSPALG